jgi:hypothetical protein
MHGSTVLNIRLYSYAIGPVAKDHGEEIVYLPVYSRRVADRPRMWLFPLASEHNKRTCTVPR